MRNLLNDNKGLIQILLSPVIFIIALILILLATFGFFFGSLYLIFTNYLLIIGATFIGVFFVILIHGFKGKEFSRNKSIFLAITLFIGIGFIFGSGVLQEEFGGGNYVNVPTFGFYKCEPSDVKSSSPYNSIPISGSGFVTCPSNSESCDVEIKAPVGDKFLFENNKKAVRIVYQICDISSGNCFARVYQDNFNLKSDGLYAKVPNMLINQKIWIDYQQKKIIGWENKDGATYRFNYNPFVINRYDTFSASNGDQFTTNEQGCKYPTGNKEFIISTTLSAVKSPSPDANNLELGKYKTRTFVSQFVPISVENYDFVNFGGKNAYCSGNNIYGIDEITTASGTYKIVNIGVNPLLDNVQCCPSNTLPNAVCDASTFTWKTIKVDEETGETNVECSAFKPCPIPAGQYEISGDKQLQTFQCVSNKCIASYKEVECTNSITCGSGKTCDFKTYTCEILKGGTILEGKNESQLTRSDCKFYENFVESSKEVGTGWLGIGKVFGLTTTINTTQCKTSPAWFLGAFTIIAGLFAVLIALTFKKK